MLTGMFRHTGTWSTFRGRQWGAPVDPASPHYDGHSFVTFLQNHDQVGNRARGDRIHHGLDPARHAAAIALVLLGPGTPMLFQGEEWAASTPFAYFTDHDEELGALVSAGRAEEFAAMGWADQVFDPQDRGSFEQSMLQWQERTEGDHARMLAWYRTLIALRREHPELRDPDLRRVEAEVLSEDAVLLRRGSIEILAHRGDGGLETGSAPPEVLAAFGQVAVDETAGLHLDGPGVVVTRS